MVQKSKGALTHTHTHIYTLHDLLKNLQKAMVRAEINQINITAAYLLLYAYLLPITQP